MRLSVLDFPIKSSVQLTDYVYVVTDTDNYRLTIQQLATFIGGGGGSTSWGGIGGTLSNQTDLQTALNLKANTSSLAAVATSGAYSSLSGLPTLGNVAALTYPGGTTNFLRADGTFAAPPGGGGAAWGAITGTLSSQTDLNTALGLKAPLASPTFTGTVAGITSTMVGLGNVDNTSDANKPVSTAQQTALNLKANLASPTFTGTVAGITATMVGLGNVTNTSDANKPVSTAQQTALNLKADLASPTFTGTPAAPTAAAATNTTQVATTAFVTTADNLKANLASPTFTGTPAAPTATTGTSTTQLATTAFVQQEKLIPVANKSADFTAVLTDANTAFLHPSADTTARVFTLPANSSVAYPIGTTLTVVNQNAAGVVTIAITTDTMRLAGAGTTGSRTLAANGVATIMKITATEWIANGTGLT